MTEDEIWQAVAAERITLADLLEPLPDSDWDHPSLCTGWRIRDVVAHVILATRSTIGAVLIDLIRARFNIHRMIRDSSIRYADRHSPAQLLAELRKTSTNRFTPIGTTPADRLLDLLVHGQDIAVPLNQTRVMPTAAAHLSLTRVWANPRAFPTTEKLANYHLVATDADWSNGTGPKVEGSVAALLLLSTGRPAALPLLSGPGAPTLSDALA